MPFNLNSMVDYYKTLEIDYFASQEDIKKAYRTLVKKYHPDKGMVNSDEEIKILNEAYRILCDDVLKSRYDFACINLM